MRRSGNGCGFPGVDVPLASVPGGRALACSKTASGSPLSALRSRVRATTQSLCARLTGLGREHIAVLLASEDRPDPGDGLVVLARGLEVVLPEVARLSASAITERLPGEVGVHGLAVLGDDGAVQWEFVQRPPCEPPTDFRSLSWQSKHK